MSNASESDAGGKRYPLSMRSTRQLREKIEQAAKQSGRSMAQEVEYRVEKSFSDDDLIAAMSGGQRFANILSVISVILRTTKSPDGLLWYQDNVVANVVGLALYKAILSSASAEAGWLLKDNPDLKDKIAGASTLISNYALFALHSKWSADMEDRQKNVHYKPDTIIDELFAGMI